LQRLYHASDEWFFLGASEDDLPRLETIPALSDISRQRGEGLESFLEERLARDTAARWVERLTGVGVGAHMLVAADALKNDPWAQAHGLVLTRDHQGVGAWTTIGPTLRLSRTPLQPGRPSPPLGTDLPAVLEEVGMGDQLDALIEKHAASMSYAAQRPV
jgi:crotonobetainyl-CoA:carnitine CoA-transferase CaiB-like acyl-CoA transferase